MTEKSEFAPENPKRDEIVAEALISGNVEDAGGEYVPSKSAEEIEKMRLDAKHDRSVLETLGKIKPPKRESKEKNTQKREWRDGDDATDMWGVSKETQDKFRDGTPLSPAELQEIQDFENRNKEDGKEFFGNYIESSVEHILFQLLESQYPEMGCSVSDVDGRSGNENNETLVTVTTTSEVTDRELIKRILENPIVRLLKGEHDIVLEQQARRVIEELRGEENLEGFLDRLKASGIHNRINELSVNGFDYSSLKHEFVELGAVQLAYDEMMDILKLVIEDEMKNGGE